MRKRLTAARATFEGSVPGAGRKAIAALALMGCVAGPTPSLAPTRTTGIAAAGAAAGGVSGAPVAGVTPGNTVRLDFWAQGLVVTRDATGSIVLGAVEPATLTVRFTAQEPGGEPVTGLQIGNIQSTVTVDDTPFEELPSPPTLTVGSTAGAYDLAWPLSSSQGTHSYQVNIQIVDPPLVLTGSNQ